MMKKVFLQKINKKMLFGFVLFICMILVNIQNVGYKNILIEAEETEEIYIIPTPIPAPIVTPEPKEIYLGIFESTAYIATGNRCADGTYPIPYKTCAVDPKVIPLGTILKAKRIDTGEEFIVKATDTGGAIKGRIIDMFLPSYNEAIQWGRKNVKIWIIKE